MSETSESIPGKTVKKRRSGRFGWILFFLLAIFITMQFFQPAKNNNDRMENNAIGSIVEVPDSVDAILQKACYDCHSNHTNYPWYTNIQPVGWWLENHINEGKHHLNFSEFATIAPRKDQSKKQRQQKALKEVKHEVEEGDMPLSSYTIIHTEARLSDAEKKIILNWADSAIAEIGKSAD